MRKLLTFLIALASIIFAVCSPASAVGPCDGSLVGMAICYRPPPSASSPILTYVGPIQTETSGGSTITYNSVPFGAAAPNRVIAAVFGCRSAGGTNMLTSGVTINGISATHVTGADGSSAALQGGSAIWYVSSSSGTSGSIVVTWSSACTATGVQVYTVNTSTPAPSSSNGTVGSGTTANTAITVPPSGVGVTGVYIQNGGSAAWTNATSDNDGVITGGRALDVAHTTGAGPISITATFGSSPNAASSAAWGP